MQAGIHDLLFPVHAGRLARKARGSALADSILDRIIPSAYTMRIDGDVSMRQRKRAIKG